MNSILAKIINGVKKHQRDIFLGFCMLLISIIGYNIGRINGLNKITTTTTGQELNVFKTRITSTSLKPTTTSKTQPSQPRDLRVVASKASSSKKYHFTWCPGAKKIKEINKLWFDNESLAQKAGYTLAGNCQ